MLETLTLARFDACLPALTSWFEGLEVGCSSHVDGSGTRVRRLRRPEDPYDALLLFFGRDGTLLSYSLALRMSDAEFAHAQAINGGRYSDGPWHFGPKRRARTFAHALAGKAPAWSVEVCHTVALLTLGAPA